MKKIKLNIKINTMEINLVKSIPCNLFGTKYEEDVNRLKKLVKSKLK